ncbi:MAG: glycosyltransferase, partial [Roseovarius sp.]|nr:glycosyltransferase [Roseovarius sp.]
LDYPAYKVIVVDNGSSDGSIDWLQCNAPEVRVIALDQNIGFADAVNLAFDNAPTQLFAVLNNDMVVDSQWLRELVEALRRVPQRAAATSKFLFFKPFITISFTASTPFSVSPSELLANHAYKKFFVENGRIAGDDIWSVEAANSMHSMSVKVPCEIGLRLPIACSAMPDEEVLGSVRVALNGVPMMRAKVGTELMLDADTLAEAGRWVVNNAGSMETSEDVVGDRGFGQYDVGQFEVEENVDYLCGGSFIVNRSALLGKPLFIGDLFAYYEDTELSVRLRQGGFRIGYAPRSVVYHKHAATSQEKSLFFHQMIERNYSAFYARKRGDFRAITQVDRKKGQLNHLSHFYATNEASSDHELALSTVYPKVISQLDNLLEAMVQGREFHGSHRALRIAVYNSYWSTAGGGELHALNVAKALSRFGIVDLVAESDFDLPKLAVRFDLPAERFRKVLLANLGEADTAAYDVFVNSTFASNLASKARRSYYIVSFPHQWATKEVLSAYTFLPNSLFTNHWCRAFWGDCVMTKLLYPLVRPVCDSVHLDKKCKVILNVGRFFPDGHSKMQHEMVETFRQLVHKYPEFSDWTLVCAGGLDNSRAECVDYFKAIAAAAEDINIKLLPNATRSELDELYAKAALYWHATGFGKDASLTPDEFEHFGISTVEAMSAGCIPIVIHGAGQSEIVNDDAFGSTFYYRNDWIEKSAMWMGKFTKDTCAFETALQAAAKAAARFGPGHFDEQISAILADVASTDAAFDRNNPASDFTSKGYWRFSGNHSCAPIKSGRKTLR